MMMMMMMMMMILSHSCVAWVSLGDVTKHNSLVSVIVEVTAD